MVAITETKEPKLDTEFQPAYESGKSGILLGIPANPKKCWGKNVKLLPFKIKIQVPAPQVPGKAGELLIFKNGWTIS